MLQLYSQIKMLSMKIFLTNLWESIFSVFTTALSNIYNCSIFIISNNDVTVCYSPNNCGDTSQIIYLGYIQDSLLYIPLLSLTDNINIEIRKKLYQVLQIVKCDISDI